MDENLNDHLRDTKMKEAVDNCQEEIIDFEDPDIVPSPIQSSISSFNDKDNLKSQHKKTSSFNLDSSKVFDKSVLILNDY